MINGIVIIMHTRYNPFVKMDTVPVRQIPDEHDLFENNVGGCQRHFYMICRYEDFPDDVPCRCINCPHTH